MMKPSPERRPTYRPGRLALTMALLTVLQSGCTESGPDALEQEGLDSIEDSVTGRAAYLTVVSHNSYGQVLAPLNLSAQFVDFRGVQLSQVRQSLGLWFAPEHQGIDECVLSETPGPIGFDDRSQGRILLMHAGTVRFEGEGSAVELTPRRMPDLFPFFRGFTYGTASDERPHFPARSVLQVTSSGGNEVDAFSVPLSLPEPLVLTHLNDVALGSSTSVELTDLSEGLSLRWSPGPNDGAVWVTLERAFHESPVILTCAAFDGGEFFVPAHLVESVRGDSSSSPLRLTVRRAHVQPFELPGFDVAQASALTEHSILLE